MSLTVRVTGADAVARALGTARSDLASMRPAATLIASRAASTMRGAVPVRSGALRASVRPTIARARAVVTVGAANVPYAGIVQYGAAGRNIKARRYIEAVDGIMSTQAPQAIENAWGKIVRRNGL